MSGNRATVLTLLVTLLLAPVKAVIAQQIHGLLVYGHEVHTLQPCGDTRTFWLRAPDVWQELATRYRQLAARPYEPIYAELEGDYDQQPVGGFGAEYEGAIVVHAIRLITRGGVVTCRANKH